MAKKASIYSAVVLIVVAGLFAGVEVRSTTGATADSELGFGAGAAEAGAATGAAAIAIGAD